ncbi:MAG: hypothetical protein RJB01_833, partial [Actinomycetota bacterium]
WVMHTVHSFSWMMPARIRVFPVAQRADALAWVSS